MKLPSITGLLFRIAITAAICIPASAAAVLPDITSAAAAGAVITLFNPTSAAPGDIVTIYGSGFGASQPANGLYLSDVTGSTDGTVNWGQAGNGATFVIDSWSDTKISFTLPVPSGTGNQWRLRAGTTATFCIASACQLTNGAVAGPTSGMTNQNLPVVTTGNLSDYYDLTESVGAAPDANLNCSSNGIHGLDGSSSGDFYDADAGVHSLLHPDAGQPLSPGSIYNDNGNKLFYIWPNVTTCHYDLIDAGSATQTILAPPNSGASTIGFMGMGVGGTYSANATITFSDNTTQTVKLDTGDWCGSTPAGQTLANSPKRADGVICHVFEWADSVTTPSGQSVKSITIPTSATGTNTGRMRIWTIALGNGSATYPSLLWSHPADITYGTALSTTQLNATAGDAQGDVAGTFAYSNPIGTVLDAGAEQMQTATFTPSGANAADWVSGTSISTAITVNQADQTINFPNPGTQTYGTPVTVGATSTSGLDVTFGASGSCTSSGTDGATITFTGVGTNVCTVTASQSGNNDYSAAANVSQTFTVNQASQAISFTGPSQTTYTYGTDPGFTVTTAGGNSGNPVTFSIDSGSSPGACSSGGTNGADITITGVGTCSVDADQAGNADYSAAPQVTKDFTINQGGQTISFIGPSKTTYAYGTDSGFMVTATGGGSGNPVTFSVDPGSSAGACTSGGTNGASISITGVGTCTVDANQAGTANYSAAAQVTNDYAINKGAQTVIFTGPSQTTYTYGTDTGFTVTATGGASGNAVTFSIDSGSTAGACTSGGTHGASISITSPGTCIVDGNQTGNAYYSAAAQVTDTFTINKANQTPQTINFTGPSKTTYTFGTDSGFTVTATGGASGNPVIFSIDSGSTAGACTAGGTHGATISITGAGTCTVDANQAGNVNYSAAPQVTDSFTINKGSQAVSFTGPVQTTYTYGTDSGFTVTASGGGSGDAVTFGIDSGSTAAACTSGGTHGATITITGAGTCIVDANQAGSANYLAASQVTKSFTIGKATQTVTFTGPAQMTYTYGTDGGFTVSATGGNSGNPVIFSIDSGSTAGACSSSGTHGASITITGAGTCTVDGNQAGSANYSAAPQRTASFTINKAGQSISVTGPVQTTYTFGTDSGFTVTATGGSSGNPVTFSIDSGSTTGACTSGGTNGAVITITGAGTCIVDANQAGNTNYTAAPQVTANFTISQGGQAINFTGPSQTTYTYGNNGFTVTATGGGSGNPVTFSIDAGSTAGACSSGGTNGASVTITGAGSCIVDADQAGDTNYSAAPQVTDTFTINKASQSVVFTGPAQHSYTYGDNGITVSATGGGSGNAVIFTIDSASTSGACTSSGTHGSSITLTGAGNCIIDGDQGGNGNYNAASQVQDTLTVDKAALTIGPSNLALLFGDALPNLSLPAEWVASGYVNGDGNSVLTAAPTCSATQAVTNRQGIVDVSPGVYTLVCHGAVAANYTITYPTGTLTVGKEVVAVGFGGPFKVKKGATVTLKGTVNGRGVGNPALPRVKLSMTFKGGKSCTGVTNGSGLASCTVKAPAKAGLVPLTLKFAGGTDYLAAIKTVTVKVR